MDLREIYDDHAKALYAFLLQLSRCEADARDLLQEIFAALRGNLCRTACATRGPTFFNAPIASTSTCAAAAR